MNIRETGIEGLYVLEVRAFGDDRGYFMETYNERLFEERGLKTRWVQDNFSHSQKGVLRGLHFQNTPKAQAKLVRCTRGSVFDVAVDIRPGSKTFGKWYGLELSAQNKLALYVPEGFAHGFCVTSDEASFQYKVSDFYSPQDEGGIIWNDPALNINWPLKDPQLSAKDKLYKTLAETIR